jgi:DNA-binding NarL/FixJ family response regulator
LALEICNKPGKQETIMRVMIVAEPGRLRDGLQAMLDSFPALETVAVVDDGPSALEAIRSGRSDLVILDAHLFDEGTADLVCAIKQEGNGARCVVVADRLGQFQPLLDAGADAVLLKGFSAAELRTAVEQL